MSFLFIQVRIIQVLDFDNWHPLNILSEKKPCHYWEEILSTPDTVTDGFNIDVFFCSGVSKFFGAQGFLIHQDVYHDLFFCS